MTASKTRIPWQRSPSGLSSALPTSIAVGTTVRKSLVVSYATSIIQPTWWHADSLYGSIGGTAWNRVLICGGLRTGRQTCHGLPAWKGLTGWKGEPQNACNIPGFGRLRAYSRLRARTNDAYEPCVHVNHSHHSVFVFDQPQQPLLLNDQFDQPLLLGRCQTMLLRDHTR
jgi:hypothetical protein